MKSFEHKRQSVGLAHRIQIFKKNGKVIVRTYQSIFTSAESNYFFVRRDDQGNRNPYGYFFRLAQDRYQRGRAFRNERVRRLYSRIAKSLTAGAKDIYVEENKPLPTLEQLEERGFSSCNMQDHLSFDVSNFKEKTLSFVMVFLQQSEKT